MFCRRIGLFCRRYQTFRAAFDDDAAFERSLCTAVAIASDVRAEVPLPPPRTPSDLGNFIAPHAIAHRRRGQAAAVGRRVRVAGSVGSYGASLLGGEEYTGKSHAA